MPYHDALLRQMRDEADRFNIRAGALFHTWDAIRALVLAPGDFDGPNYPRVASLAASVQFLDPARSNYSFSLPHWSRP